MKVSDQAVRLSRPLGVLLLFGLLHLSVGSLAPSGKVRGSRQLQGCSDDPKGFCEDEGGKGAIPKPDRECYDTFNDCECDDGFVEVNDRCEKESSGCSDDPEEFCEDEGGSGAIPKPDRECYDTFDDCECDDGFVEVNDRCEEEGGCSDDPEEFCEDEGGPGAIPKADRECYDTFDDCECDDGFVEVNDRCEEEGGCSDDPEEFCEDEGGPGAIPKPDRECYDTFDDCECDDGFIEVNDQCEEGGGCSDDPEAFCREEGGVGAIPKADRECYDTFDDCECDEGFEEDNDRCEEDDGCSDDPEDFCRNEGGDGAFPKPDSDCYDTFDDCDCFDGFLKIGSSCVYDSTPLSSNQIQHVGNDGVPSFAFPMNRCFGDCDDDNDCIGKYICLQRSGDDAVPGCLGGENESTGYDYCVDPCDVVPRPSSCSTSTPRPTISPSASPSMKLAEDTSLTPLPVPVLPPFLVAGSPTQQNNAIQIKYAGRFQKIEEPACSFPQIKGTPDVTAGCANGRIEVVGVSHSSIVCGETVADGAGGTQVSCTNTCIGESCHKVFMGTSFWGDFGNFSKFGEVLFQCEGDTIDSNVSGWFRLTPKPGSCGSTDAGAAAFQSGQLGVWCSDAGAYSFDDSLAECNMESQSVNLDGVYTCTSGRACSGQPCQFSMEEIMITSDRHRFPPACVVTSSGAAVPPLLPAPLAPPPALQTHDKLTALFQVNMGFYYDQAVCQGLISRLRMTCLNGEVTLVDNKSVMSCATFNETTIECSESAAAIATRNQYVGILQYECTSSSHVPGTEVESIETSVGCVSPVQEQVSLELQLGVVCGETLNAIVYDDYLYECGNEWSTLSSRTGEFTCGVTNTFPAMANPALRVQLPSVEIGTDYRWDLLASSMSCLRSSNTTVSASRTGPP